MTTSRACRSDLARTIHELARTLVSRSGRTPALFADAGFRLVKHGRFQLGVNNFFVFEK